jgi:DNA-binding NarL/FixJ family response regulator
MRKTRLLVADDHDVVRMGMVALLTGRPEWEVCGQAATGRDAIAAAAELKPDVVVMDISMPDMNGLEATRRILQENPGIQVLIVSMHDSDQLVREALASGARGYMLKTDAGRDIFAALNALRQHKLYFTSRVSELVLRGYLTGEDAVPHESPSLTLTPREREIVQLLAEGRSNKEVAGTLRISIKTVETHRAHIMNKLHLHSVSDLVRYAIRNHIIEI